MEPLNFGDKLEVWDAEIGWILFCDAYLTEATEYKLRYAGKNLDVRFQGIPIPFYPEGDHFVCSWMTPFQSGLLTLSINQQQYETYIYPDNRKLTEEQYQLMIKEILEEAEVCFQYSGLEVHVDVLEKSRIISWPQWLYIEQNFSQLRKIFARIEQQPFRQLEKLPIMMKRDQVRIVSNEVLHWLDRQGYGDEIPKNVQSVKTFETTKIYENQVLKQQLIDLLNLLQKYESTDIDEISLKINRFKVMILKWLNGPFLAEVAANTGPYMITQRFRKHPIYRGWYQWFDKLYKHKYKGIGFSYPIPLKDTFQLYEMWCFMMIVKVMRELGYVLDTKDLFNITYDGIFLNLAENKESRIKLKDGTFLFFQRNYQYNSKRIHTYTQRMIPDIVIEGENHIVIFDPKYRIPDNLGTALGEMHKYRDGIIHRDTNKQVVRQVFILTPTKKSEVETLRYFNETFHKKYGMGAIEIVPGENMDHIRDKVWEAMELVQDMNGDFK